MTIDQPTIQTQTLAETSATPTAKARLAQRGAARTAEGQNEQPRPNKSSTVLALLRRKSGATVAEIVAETGWQPHSVRGFLSGTVRKKLGLNLRSVPDRSGIRRYRIAKAGANAR